MKPVKITYVLTGLMLSALMTSAQRDSIGSGNVFFRSVTITGSDTIINERRFDFDGTGQSGSFTFRFGDGADTVISGYGGGFNFNATDSLFEQFFTTPFGRGSFFNDSSWFDFRFSMPDSAMPPNSFRRFSPDVFSAPDTWSDMENVFHTSRKPNFSIEDVEAYKPDNSVKNFVVRPVPGASILMVEADLDNKRSTYTVYDNRGNTIHHERLRRVEGDFKRVIDLSELKSGTYFVQIKNGKSTKKKRITVR
jgi:hypothetical protein